MNILILGANGYLGSKIAHTLVERGDFLICTRRKYSDLSNLSCLTNNDSVRFISTSIEELDNTMENMAIEWILNFVCNYGRSGTSNNDVIVSNLEFPLKVMCKAMEKGITNFLTIGTGLPDDLNIYSFSKKIFSRFGEFYSNKQGINFFDIPYLIYNMLMGNEINVTWGKQHRDVISVRDVVNAVIIAMNSNKTGYNQIPVGTGIAIPISELVDYIWEETGKKSKVNKGAVPLREDEPDCVADTSILTELGDWHPIFWKNGIKQMIADIKSCERI